MRSQKFPALVIFFLVHLAIATAQSPIESMEKYKGDWKATYTMWMMPGDPPMIDSIKVHCEMTMNDLFFIAHLKGSVMAMDYEGNLTIGYDLEKKLFVNSLIDNMNSGIAYFEGKATDAGNQIDLHGTGFDSETGKNMETREVLTFHSDKHLTIDFYKMVNGVERQTHQIDMSR